jgi:hypothetical protein
MLEAILQSWSLEIEPDGHRQNGYDRATKLMLPAMTVLRGWCDLIGPVGRPTKEPDNSRQVDSITKVLDKDSAAQISPGRP